MNATVDPSLLSKLEALTPEQLAEVEDFVEFLGAKARKRLAVKRLLSIAPALEALGTGPMGEEEIAGEIEAVRRERRARSKV